MTDVEKPAEGPKTSPSEAQALTEKVGIFLSQLRMDVAKESEAGKDALIQGRLATLDRDQLDELAKQVHTTGEIVGAHVKILDLVDQRKDALRKQLASQQKPAEQPAVSEKKPEGIMASFGAALTTGAQSISEWGGWLWGKSKSGAGAGWEGFLTGLKATGDFFVRMWNTIKVPLNKAREGIAVALGSIVVSMDKVLPAWLKNGFNVIAGHFGVFYATVNRLGVKVIQNTQEAAQTSIDNFYKLYEQASAWGNTNLDFSGFIRQVAGRLRDQKKSLEFTMAEMIEAATQLISEKPAVVPAATTGPVSTSPEVAAVRPQDAVTLEQVSAGTTLLNAPAPLKLWYENKFIPISVASNGRMTLGSNVYQLKGKVIGSRDFWLFQTPPVLVDLALDRAVWNGTGMEIDYSVSKVKKTAVIDRPSLESFLKLHNRGQARFENNDCVIEKIA